MEKEYIQYNRINDVSITDDQSPTSFPSHWHNDTEFTLILKDGCRYRVRDEIITPEAGDIFMVWPRELHEIIHVPENGSIFIQFSSKIIDNNIDILSASRFFKKYHLLSQKNNPELTGYIKDKIFSIQDIFSQNPHFAETRCKQLIYDILMRIGEFIIEEQREQIGSDRFSGKAWEYIRAAYSYISEHSTENISQTDVAEKIGLSPYYFSKLFNDYSEMSFPTYIAGIRVQNAISLLANDDLSITDCAFMAGFQSTTTFNKMFLEVTGCSPREYRKLHRI